MVNQPEMPLQDLAPGLSAPTTSDTRDAGSGEHLTSTEPMSQLASQSNVSGSGPSSPAKTTPALPYIPNGNISTQANQNQRASLKPKPLTSSTNSSLVQSLYSLHNRPSPYGNSPGAATSQGFAGGGGSFNSLPSKHLITVIPPDCLPHDPPHPRANPQASGYGPPENFKRGVLLPLYPTLSGQLGAIAREYGLPSKGGLIVYLLELSTELVSDGPHQAFVGGPRISEEAWQLLWSRLFEYEMLQREEAYRMEDDTLDLSELEDEDSHQQSANYSSRSQYRASRPPVPPVPEQHRSAPAYDERYSDRSSRDNSDAPSPDFYATSMDASASSVTSPPVNSSSHSMASQQQQRKRLSHGPRSPPPAGMSRPGSRASRRPPTSQSMRSFRRNTSTSLASSTASYGPSVIVGKLEFDIDRRRGAGKWYDAWMEQAMSSSTPQPQFQPTMNFNGPPYSNFNSPANSTYASPAETERRAPTPAQTRAFTNNAQEGVEPQSARGSGRAELYLPGLVNRKSRVLQSMSPSSSMAAMARHAPESPRPTLESLAQEEESSLNLSLDTTKASIPNRASTPSVASDAQDQEEFEVSASQQEYTQLADDDGDSDSQDGAATTQDLHSRPTSNVRISRASSTDQQRSSLSRNAQAKDPLSDVFGQDEANWNEYGQSAGPQLGASGLGLGLGMSNMLGSHLASEQEEHELPPADDVQEVKDMLGHRSSQRSAKRRSVANALSSPIHLDREQFQGPSDNSPSTFEASMPKSDTPPATSTAPETTIVSTATADRSDAAFAPTITHEMPSGPASRTNSVSSQLPGMARMSEMSKDEEEKDLYRPSSPSKWSSFAALHGEESTPLSSSKTEDRESVEMDFDNLERALAELSPKARRRPGTTSSKVSSPRPSNTSQATSPAFQQQSYASAQRQELRKASHRSSIISARSNLSEPSGQSLPAQTTSDRLNLVSQRELPAEKSVDTEEPAARTEEQELPEKPQADIEQQEEPTEQPGELVGPEQDSPLQIQSKPSTLLTQNIVAAQQPQDSIEPTQTPAEQPRTLSMHPDSQVDPSQNTDETSQNQPGPPKEGDAQQVQESSDEQRQLPSSIADSSLPVPEDSSEPVAPEAAGLAEGSSYTQVPSSSDQQPLDMTQPSQLSDFEPSLTSPIGSADADGYERKLQPDERGIEHVVTDEPSEKSPTSFFEAPRSPPGLPYMTSNSPPAASGSREHEASTPTSAQFGSAPTTFETLLSPQSYVAPEQQPPARGSSLQNSLRKPWAARTSPNQQSPSQFQQNGDSDTSSSGSGNFMSKLFPGRKNSHSKSSDEHPGAGLSPAVKSKLQHSPRDRGTPVFNSPPHQTSILAQRRKKSSSPRNSPRQEVLNDDSSNQIDYAAQARAYFESDSNDPLAGLRDSPSARTGEKAYEE